MGQPGWARPALLCVVALAAFAYAYGIGSVNLEPFYGGAARSMSQSWHDFFFGAADPWGTVTVDKLPGALWVQALSLRVFGFHLWAIVLPQVVEGVLTVLVLYRAVRRVAGPAAGLVAAGVLAVSPVTVLLNRGNISDSLLILLLVLAADATTRAIVEGRSRSLVVAGVWVGLAFQAKMLQAWLVLPALYGAYLFAAPASRLLRRSARVGLCVLVVGVVSLSYMSVVAVVPAHDRPYVDGSCDDSIFSQVFLYNGLNRLHANELDLQGCSPPSKYLVALSREGAALGVGTYGIHSGWDRLLKGVFGRDIDWLLVPSLVAAGGLLVGRRRQPRTDPIRAVTVLWTTWLVVTAVFFSQGQFLNSYYLAALVPPMAALYAMGAREAWRHRDSALVRAVVMGTVVLSTIYAIALIPSHTGIRPWVISSTLVLGALAVVIIAGSLVRNHDSVWAKSTGLALAGLVLVSTSAWATAAEVANGEGPFESPYEPASVTFLSQTAPALFRTEWPELDAYAATFPTDHAVDVFETSGDAGYDIMATGHEFLPVGGFSGRVPSTTVVQFERHVAEGRATRVLVAVAPLTSNPVLLWVTTHCPKQTIAGATFRNEGASFRRYQCLPQDARGTG